LAGRKDGVQGRVSFSTFIATFGAVLIIVAGILISIGLGEIIVAGSFINAKFDYAVDPTPFGSEIPPRNLYNVTHGVFDTRGF